MAKLLLLLGLSTLLLLASSKVYNTNMTCGACTKTTGCTGNMCTIITGDVASEYCYGSATCGFSGSQTVQFGLCSMDLSGQNCSSGVCMAGASSNMCFSTYGGSCPGGTTFTQTCSGQTVSVSYTMPGISAPVTASVNLGYDCPFTSSSGSYTNCTGDVYGGSCNCCAGFNITGMSNVMGSCIPSTSPLVAVKASLGDKIVALVSGMLVFVLAFLF